MGAPWLQHIRRNSGINHHHHDNYKKPGLSGWKIAVVIIAIVILIAVIAFGTFWWMRRRKYTQANQHERELDNADDFDVRKAPMSEAELWEAEERERSMMIRKSLASRTEYSSGGAGGAHGPYDNPFVDPPESRGQLQQEYKEWEAGERDARTNSVHDPVIQGHPALSPTPPSGTSRSASPHDRY